MVYTGFKGDVWFVLVDKKEPNLNSGRNDWKKLFWMEVSTMVLTEHFGKLNSSLIFFWLLLFVCYKEFILKRNIKLKEFSVIFFSLVDCTIFLFFLHSYYLLSSYINNFLFYYIIAHVRSFDITYIVKPKSKVTHLEYR